MYSAKYIEYNVCSIKLDMKVLSGLECTIVFID